MPPPGDGIPPLGVGGAGMPPLGGLGVVVLHPAAINALKAISKSGFSHWEPVLVFWLCLIVSRLSPRSGS